MRPIGRHKQGNAVGDIDSIYILYVYDWALFGIELVEMSTIEMYVIGFVGA